MVVAYFDYVVLDADVEFQDSVLYCDCCRAWVLQYVEIGVVKKR